MVRRTASSLKSGAFTYGHEAVRDVIRPGRSDGVTGHFPLDCVALYAEDARERFFLTKVLIRTYSLRLVRCRELAADYSA